MRPPSKRCSGFSWFPTQQPHLQWTERNVCFHRSAQPQLSWFCTSRLCLSSPQHQEVVWGCEFDCANACQVSSAGRRAVNFNELCIDSRAEKGSTSALPPSSFLERLAWAMGCTPLSLFNAPSIHSLWPPSLSSSTVHARLGRANPRDLS